MQVQVLDRAVALLQALSEGRRTTREMAAATGVTRSTTYRLLQAMVRLGLVEQCDNGFRMGPRVLELGCVTDQDRFLTLAQRVSCRLQRATRQSVQVYRRIGRMRECVVSVNKTAGLRSVVPTGALMELDLDEDSAGLVLRAWDASPVPAASDRDRDIAKQLERVRRQGWSVTTVDSTTSVSAPISAPSSQVIGAITISGGPQLDVDAARLARQAGAAAALIEAGLRDQMFADSRTPARPPATLAPRTSAPAPRRMSSPPVVS